MRIEQFDREIVVEDGDTILQAALDAGLDYPFMCQQGQCGACKAQLISGQVDLGTYYNPLVLTEEERVGGQILACQAEPQTDCVISIGVLDGEVSHVLRDLDYEVLSVSPSTDFIALRLRNRSAEPFHFSAGQFARLSFDGYPPVEAGMVNRPDDEELLFHLPHVSGDLFCQFVAGLAEGAIIGVEGPFGSAYLREEHFGPILLVGLGADRGKLLSIAETALKSGMAQQIVFFGDARADASTASRVSDLQNTYRNFQWRAVAIDLAASASSQTGEMRTSIGNTFDDFQGFHVYLAGSSSFCASMCESLVAQGLEPGNCYFDPIETHA
ncbi:MULTISPECIES: 2Fe-2S iron-sulfur cluster-binding protein [unclassified Beijerinckia]|uniref:2Fe-2S iron-sulfur cluster-binding protein n=1 Tax=unclassified Beijerinckia TaxID=2638183 RepID=UPI00147DD565|nr:MULTISPECIES: 2Fe-2S iron-sulfur cluster-binding protein [unclassified Beijerinckia]